MRIKRDVAVAGDNGVDLTTEEAGVIWWLKGESEFMTPQGSFRQTGGTIDREVGIYCGLAMAHLKNPEGRNESKAEFYLRKVADIEKADRIGFSARSVRESFLELFRLYAESGRSKEASELLENYLSKGCGRGSFNRKDSMETLTLYQCTGIIVCSDLSKKNTAMAPLIPVLEKNIDTLDGIDSIHALYYAMSRYFLGISFFSKALIYAKKRLHAVQKSPKNRYGKLECSALVNLAKNCSRFGMYEDALSHLKIADQIITPTDVNIGLGPWEKSLVYEALGDTLKEQAEVTKMKELRKRLHLKSISYYKKSCKLRYDLLEEFGASGGVDTDTEDILTPTILCSFKIGRQLANNKMWSQAKEYSMIGVELVERHVNDSKSVAMAYPMVYPYFGKVFLDQYLHSDYYYLEDEAKLLLHSAAEYTQKGLAAFKRMPALSKGVYALAKLPISFDMAVESYFLGRKEPACQMLACHLNARTAVQSCAACGHAWIKGGEFVNKICANCDAVCYCNDVCQQRHWKNVDDKRMSHKRLCPLLKEVKGFGRTESLHRKILDFFEDLKPSKRREAHVTDIDNVD